MYLQAVEVRKQLEQQHCASQKYADELKREAGKDVCSAFFPWVDRKIRA